MATRCFTTLRGKAARVTQLDDCCAIPAAEGLMVVSEGFISVSLSAELESGDEFVVKNANGRLCVNERSPDALKRINVEIDWCEVDPDIIALITGFPQELDETDAVGFRVTEGTFETRWALELWTGLAGEHCAEGDPCFGYLLLPCITGSSFGDITVENGASNFVTMGYTEGNSEWGVGPYDVINDPATPLDDPFVQGEHALIRTTCVAPPEPSCGSQPIPVTSPTSP